MRNLLYSLFRWSMMPLAIRNQAPWSLTGYRCIASHIENAPQGRGGWAR